MRGKDSAQRSSSGIAQAALDLGNLLAYITFHPEAMYKVTSTAQFAKSASRLSVEGSSEASWTPNTDVYICEEGLVVKVELAGMRREDLELSIEGNRLKISGQRPDGCRTGKCNFLAMEINYGPFESQIELPPGYDLSRARASYQNGFLRVDVPTQLAAERKKTTIIIAGQKPI